jgi:hypothetical protein
MVQHSTTAIAHLSNLSMCKCYGCLLLQKDSSFQCASFELKKFYSIFSFKRNSQKTEKTQIFPYFWLPHQQLGSMTGTFPMPEFNSSYRITHRNFVRIGDKKFFRKNHVPLPSIDFAPRKNI